MLRYAGCHSAELDSAPTGLLGKKGAANGLRDEFPWLKRRLPTLWTNSNAAANIAREGAQIQEGTAGPAGASGAKVPGTLLEQA